MPAPHFNWDVIWNALAILVWLGQARWVQLDAERKYGRGRFWGLVALCFPFAGIVAYLMFQHTSLVEIDMFDAEMSWQLADTVQVNGRRPARLTAKRGFGYRRPGPSGPTRADKLKAKELRERAERIALTNPLLAKELRENADLLDPPKPPKKPWKVRWKEFWLLRRDAASLRRSRKAERREWLKRPKKLRTHELFMKKLSETPYVDPTMEGLLFEGQYEVARERATINLQIAEEEGDSRKRVTYRRYLDQISKLSRIYLPGEENLSTDIERYHLGEE
jgi:hypothetical protein